MPIARKHLIDPRQPTWVHCISRCVRRAYLCGENALGESVDHRKAWIEARLRTIAGVFAVEVAGYSVMSNHLHLVLRMRPAAVASWSAREVAERWCALFDRGLPKRADGRVVPATVAHLSGNGAWIAERRARLADLSWLMRALCEDVARRANREDQCTGRFWEGRFKSVPLLDQAALVACMAYVDLNPIRAKLADRPETARFTGARARIKARQAHRAAARLRRSGRAAQAADVLRRAGLAAAARDGEDGLWLAPVSRCVAGTDAQPAATPLTSDDYLRLIDATGRLLRDGKRGRIPPDLAPILARLDLDLEHWLAAMLGWRQFAGRAIGALAARAAEATRLGLRWVQNRCALFGLSRPAPAIG